MNEMFDAYIDESEIEEKEPGVWKAKLSVCITGVLPADIARGFQRLTKTSEVFTLTIQDD